MEIKQNITITKKPQMEPREEESGTEPWKDFKYSWLAYFGAIVANDPPTMDGWPHKYLHNKTPLRKLKLEQNPTPHLEYVTYVRYCLYVI